MKQYFQGCGNPEAKECPQALRPKNLKSVAMATVDTGYPPKPNQL